MSSDWGKHSDKLMSIAAIITAVVAVTIGFVEVRTERQFQKLSVEPYLELGNANRDGYEFILINSGLGPATIKTYLRSVNGEIFSE